MTLIAWTVVSVSLGWLFFGHVGYPCLMAALARWSPRPFRTGSLHPPLSVIVTVHDGEDWLARKLRETLALKYPARFEVIVASDGSTDRTDDIARSFGDRGVILVRNDRAGKEAAMARAIERAQGEVLAFTDVTTTVAPDALVAIVRPFADPQVGCVSSEDRPEGAALDDAYLGVEMRLRRWESRAASLAGLSGPFFAVRKDLCHPWPADLASDMRIALEAARRGFRAVSWPSARSSFPTGKQGWAGEWHRRVRTSQRGIAVLSAYRDLLHPRHGRVALVLWGHKLARFTGAVALLGLLCASALLAFAGTAGAVLAGLQLLLYAVGALALSYRWVARWGTARTVGFFVLAHGATLVALVKHVRGERRVTWAPTARGAAPVRTPPGVDDGPMAWTRGGRGLHSGSPPPPPDAGRSGPM